MEFNYKTITGIEPLGKDAFGIRVQMAIDRELTDDEQSAIARSVQELVNKIQPNTYHMKPETQEAKIKEKAKLLALFPVSIYVEEIPNEYDISYGFPWFKVTTPKGHIKIGWRKRVIVIDWFNTKITGTPKDLFPNEDVTKGAGYGQDGFYIHAWGYEKAQEYINKLLS